MTSTPPADAALAEAVREPGYYSVLRHGVSNWTPAMWTGHHWYVCANDQAYAETQFAKIGPRIPSPDELPPAPPSEGAALAQRLEALAKKATLGPWRFDREDNDDGTITFDIFGGEWLIAQAIDDIGPRARHDFEFIVALHSNLSVILAALRQPSGSVVTAALRAARRENAEAMREAILRDVRATQDAFEQVGDESSVETCGPIISNIEDVPIPEPK